MEKSWENFCQCLCTPEGASEGGSYTKSQEEERAYDSFLGDENWDVHTINLRLEPKHF